MIEQRGDWPSMLAEIEESSRAVDPASLPPSELILQMLSGEFEKRGLSISEEDVRFASVRVHRAAEFYRINFIQERIRPSASQARTRLNAVATKANDLLEVLVPLDYYRPSPRRRVGLGEFSTGKVRNGQVAHLLETALLAERGDQAVAQLLVPGDSEASDAEVTVIQSRLCDELFDAIAELARAADKAAQLPLGKSEIPAWPLYRNPKVTLRAVENAVDEIAQMFGMLLSDMPSPSRFRNPEDENRDAGPLVTPILLFFGWVEDVFGPPPPSASSIEKALARIFGTPRSLVNTRFRRRPHDSAE